MRKAGTREARLLILKDKQNKIRSSEKRTQAMPFPYSNYWCRPVERRSRAD